MPVDFYTLKQKAAQNTLKPQVTAGNSTYSVGIVNSKYNGKRVSLSKALSSKLELSDTAAFMPIAEDRVLLIGKSLSFCEPIVGKLSGGDKKFCYNSGLVLTLTEEFGLDFSSCTSKSYSKIQIQKDESGEMIAIVSIA